MALDCISAMTYPFSFFLMAYIGALIDGAKLAFMVGLVLAVTNGLTQRATGETLDGKVAGWTSGIMTKVGA